MASVLRATPVVLDTEVDIAPIRISRFEKGDYLESRVRDDHQGYRSLEDLAEMRGFSA